MALIFTSIKSAQTQLQRNLLEIYDLNTLQAARQTDIYA